MLQKQENILEQFGYSKFAFLKKKAPLKIILQLIEKI